MNIDTLFQTLLLRELGTGRPKTTEDLVLLGKKAVLQALSRLAREGQVEKVETGWALGPGIPPKLTNGQLELLEALGDDLTVEEWAWELKAPEEEIRRAQRWLKEEKRS